MLQAHLSLHHQFSMLDTAVVQYSLITLTAVVLKDLLMNAALQDTHTQGHIATIFVI